MPIVINLTSFNAHLQQARDLATPIVGKNERREIKKCFPTKYLNQTSPTEVSMDKIKIGYLAVHQR